MAAIPGEYEDGGDEEFTLPLPPEDRLWRHPSELGQDELTLQLDPTSVRNRWLSSQPSRASAWTAGLVGALLASGLVVLGTHLATALTAAPSHSAASQTRTTAASTLTAAAALASGATALGAAVAAEVRNVGQGVVTIDAATPAGDVQQLGVVVSADGTVLTAAASVAAATSVLINLPHNEVVPAVSVTADPASGLAVLRVNGVSGLPTTALAPAGAGESSFVVAVTSPGGDSDALGDVRQLDARPRIGDHALVDATLTDLPVASPPGSPVLNAAGAVVGVVAGVDADRTAVVPSWLALPIARELIAKGAVQHGWIGIAGATSATNPAGALVERVSAKGAGAEAGIRPGDVITALDGKRVRSITALQGRLYAMQPGTSVVVSLTRGDHRLNRHLRLDDQAA